MAKAFYLKHGATQLEPALELLPTVEERVMISSYCIRREIGQCLKERPTLKGELYIEHGAARYKLDFDCAACRMSLVDCSNTLQKR
jgi:putative protease